MEGINTPHPSGTHGHDPSWDMVIESRSNVFSLHLRDVWNYRDLLWLLVRRDFVSFYKQTILGPVWFFLQPALTTITFMFIFGRLAGLSTDGIDSALFYMSGVVTWNYFAECLTKTSTVFKDNANIFGKVYFPRLIMPISIVFSNLMKFFVQVLLLILLFLYKIFVQDYDVQINAYILLVPVLVLVMACLGLGLGMIISAMTTKYRDLAFLLTFGVQLLMYLTPVIYPLSSAPDKLRAIIEWNPMSPIIEGVRYGLFGQGSFSLSYLGYSLGITAVILMAGTIIFNRVEKKFVDTI